MNRSDTPTKPDQWINGPFKTCLLLFSVFWITACPADPPVIAVASNLTAPVTEITEAFRNKTGDSLRLSFGSSGNLSRQIVQGAPYTLFISAGRQYVDFLLEEKAPVKSAHEFIRGEIGFFIPELSLLQEYETLEEVVNALKFKSYRRIAIANPELAPYGAAAMQALRNAGLWVIGKSRLILAESVAQVIPYALSGNVDLAVIPGSFMLENNLDTRGNYFPVPPAWHDPIIQFLVIMDDADPVTLHFRTFLKGGEARDIFERFGYRVIQAE